MERRRLIFHQRLVWNGWSGRGCGAAAEQAFQRGQSSVSRPKQPTGRGSSSSTAPRMSRVAARIRLFSTSAQAWCLEGALIACVLVGAKEAVFYISEAFPRSATAITAAAATAGVRCTEWAEQADGPEPSTNTDVAVRIAVAPTAYISGEDTAALAVLAGGSPLPTRRPPYPVTEGLLGKPTAVLNVETAATIAVIFREGPEWYRALGTGSSAGTVLCTLGEELNRPGVYEIEFGRPMREVLLDAGGGLRSGEAIRAVLPRRPLLGISYSGRARRADRPRVNPNHGVGPGLRCLLGLRPGPVLGRAVGRNHGVLRSRAMRSVSALPDGDQHVGQAGRPDPRRRARRPYR